jgi:hypothetical protein
MKLISCLLFFLSFNIFAIDSIYSDYEKYLHTQIRIEYSNLLKTTDLKINHENLPTISQKENSLKSDVINYTLHGFMGSPYEMKVMFDQYLEEGDIVFNDLILGHGLNADVANKFKYKLFYKHAEKNLNFVFKNAKKVRLSGFSTGGLIISNYLYHHPENWNKIESIKFISPYFIPHLSFTPYFGYFISLFAEKINADFFYRYTHYPDVEIITLLKDYYLNDIPLLSALEINNLAKKFREDVISTNFIFKDLKNVEIYLTENDEVLNPEKSYEFLSKIFPAAKINYLKGDQLPHHLMAPLVSKLRF